MKDFLTLWDTRDGLCRLTVTDNPPWESTRAKALRQTELFFAIEGLRTRIYGAQQTGHLSRVRIKLPLP
jgi:hypothetical protein